MNDEQYVGIPWKVGGHSRAGCDCKGLVWLWLKEQTQFNAPPPRGSKEANAEAVAGEYFEQDWTRGNVAFFREIKSGKILHVAVCLGNDRFLHIVQGCQSRIDNGLTLLRRVGYEPVGTLSPSQSDILCRALADEKVGWVQIIIAIVLLALSYALQATMAQSFKAKIGKYSQTGLLTQTNPEMPLPDILGSMVVAGNSVYQQLPDKGANGNPALQMWNQIIVLQSGPSNLIDYQTGLQIKGVSWQDKSWHSDTNVDGIIINPTQDKANAITGSISGDTQVPSITLYDGAYGITVPVDIRANYDRSFPVYGLSGCSYLVGRWVNATNFANFNLTCRVQGRICRQFDNNGFTSTAVAGEALTGANGTKVRFKMAQWDVKDVTSVVVNGTAYTELSATNQAGNIYRVNYLKGYIEFMTAPANAATVSVSYHYYNRAWTRNNASHIVHLLTSSIRGKGFDGSRISWPDAVTMRDYCDANVTTVDSFGVTVGPRYQSNYAVDDRKPLEDHLKAILQACNGILFVSNGKFVMQCRAAGASVFSFNTSNILVDDQGKSTLTRELVDRGPKANRVRVFYQSDTNLNSENDAVADDENDQIARADRIGNGGIVEIQLKLPADTNLQQSERLAEMYLQEFVGCAWVYQLKTNIQGLPLQPGDIIDITHPRVPVAGKLMRIETVELDENDILSLTASEYVPQAYL